MRLTRGEAMGAAEAQGNLGSTLFEIHLTQRLCANGICRHRLHE